MNVKAVEVSGETATAKVESTYYGKNCTNYLYLRKEGRSWRIAGVSGGCPASKG